MTGEFTVGRLAVTLAAAVRGQKAPFGLTPIWHESLRVWTERQRGATIEGNGLGSALLMHRLKGRYAPIR